jgi:hypothetical protein
LPHPPPTLVILSNERECEKNPAGGYLICRFIPNTHRCRHIKVDGSGCGSRAITGEKHCYWHQTLYRQPKKLELPALEDSNALQIALNRVVQAIVAGNTDVRTASSLLYAFSLAQVNLRHITAGVAPPETQEEKKARIVREYFDDLNIHGEAYREAQQMVAQGKSPNAAA